MHQGGGLMIAGSRRPGGVVAKVENTVFTGNGALWGGAMHASVSIVESSIFSYFCPQACSTKHPIFKV